MTGVQTCALPIYFDSAMLTQGENIFEFAPKPVDSVGITGGTGSAGSGKQYVLLNINGSIYKILHDGTL